MYIHQGQSIRSILIDEDNMASNSDTKAPTQQSVKAYVLSNSGGSPGGSNKQVQFNNSSSFGGGAGFEYQSGASPNVLIVAQNAGYTALRIDSATSPSANIFDVRIAGTADTAFKVTSDGAPSGPGGSGSERFGTGSVGTCPSSVAIGYNATVGTSGGGNVAIGSSATIYTGSIRSIVIGRISSNSSCSQVTAIGDETNGTAGRTNCVSVGYANTLAHDSTILLGVSSTSTASNQLVCGSSTVAINEIYFGKGVTSSSPTSYTIAGTGGSGSNIAGGDIVVSGGKSTGTARGGTVRLQRCISGSSGSSLNSLVDALICPSRKNVSVNNSALGLFEIALPTLTGAAGVVTIEVFASDGTNLQSRSAIVRYSVVNKAGAYTSEVVVVNEGVSVSSGTLTATYAITSGTNKITFEITPNSSLTTTSYYVMFTIQNNSEQAITIL